MKNVHFKQWQVDYPFKSPLPKLAVRYLHFYINIILADQSGAYSGVSFKQIPGTFRVGRWMIERIDGLQCSKITKKHKAKKTTDLRECEYRVSVSLRKISAG